MIIMIYEWWFVESLSCAGENSSDSEYMEKKSILHYYIRIPRKYRTRIDSMCNLSRNLGQPVSSNPIVVHTIHIAILLHAPYIIYNIYAI